MTDRPMRVLTVCGTGTEVGKTWVSARLLAGLGERGVDVAASKLAQSYEPGAGPTDAEVLAEATGQPLDEVCPPRYSYEVPMAPVMAADALGRPVPRLDDLLAGMTVPAHADFLLVETAGGVRSPFTVDADAAVLVERFDAELESHDVLLVADAGLVTLNDVRLSAGAIGGARRTVFLNRWSSKNDLHLRNRRWLVDVEGLDVVVDVEDLVERWADDIASDPGRGNL